MKPQGRDGAEVRDGRPNPDPPRWRSLPMPPAGAASPTTVEHGIGATIRSLPRLDAAR